jgi:hypothetical protein
MRPVVVRVPTGTGRLLRLAAGVAVAALSCPVASAQDQAVDWMYRDRVGGSARLLGLGEAYVGLGDDVNAILANPGALTNLPRTLDSAAVLGRDGTSFVGLTSQPFRSWSFGLFWTQPARQPLDPAAPGSVGMEPAKLMGAGASVGWRPDGQRIAAGASFYAAQLSARDASDVQFKDWSGVWCFGLYFRPHDANAPRVGLVFRPSVDWRPEDETGRGLLIRKPSVLSGGVSWDYKAGDSTRLLTTLQQDLLLYTGITTRPGIPAAHDDFEYRAGVELWVPWGCTSGCGDLLQLRVAVINRAPVPFAPDARLLVETRQGPKRKTYMAGGLSYALPKLGIGKFAFESRGRFRADVGYDHETRAWVLGLSFRYPQSFRGDLQHQRRPR